MKTFFSNYLVHFFLLIFIVLNGCTKDTPKTLPVLTVSSVSNINDNSASVGGQVTSEGGATVTARGICWSSSVAAPTIADSKTTDGSGLGLFTSSLTGLTAGTTYYLRGYATNSVGTAYVGQATFKTLALAPTLVTSVITTITASSASGGGNITSDGGGVVTARGVCWSTTTNPTIADSKTSNDSGVGSFISLMTGLTSGTTYYVRAYAINSQGTSYGNQESFTTTLVVTQATVTTTAAANISTSGATLGGNVTADGNASVTERGVVYATAQNPTTANSKVAIGTGTGSFISNVTGMTSGTTYYVRAYAINSQGTSYGNQESFTTTLIVTLATVTTSAASAIATTLATLGGNVTADGNASVTERGVVYATAQNPTTANSKVAIGTGTGSFTSNVTGLTSGTTYYVRAYAINSQGTAYGNQISFATQSIFVGPVSDSDGNSYATVNIGTQVWMAENLKTTKYSNGSAIPVASADYSSYNDIPGYCWYKNDIANKNIYGGLYNWYAVNTGKLCPTSWHVPATSEWNTLVAFLGGEGVSGGKLKESGTIHWKSPNTGATNSSGFSALPGGERFYDTNFFYLNERGFWWTSTENMAIYGGLFFINYNENGVNISSEDVRDCFSIRCLKD